MSEIAISTPQHAELQTYQDANLARLEAWAQQATVVHEMANRIVGTSMCPKAYRGKPDEATAAILAGIEMGLMPMASLRAFDDIQGTPAPKAITLRAVVQSRGHDLEVVEADAVHCIVEGRRKGSDRWQRLEWTIERATLAGYPAKNPKWKTDPTAQLVARATAEMSRWLDSAAIMGMPYSAEEISDHSSLQAGPVTTRITAADIVGMAVEHAAQDTVAAIDRMSHATTEPAVVPATVDAIDAVKALSRIRHAADQADLDRIREMCRAAGLHDQSVKDAWAQRSAELADQAAPA